MGCDIHIFAEFRESESASWQKAGRVFRDPDADSEWFKKAYPDSDGLTDEPYVGRNYFLFSALADVRNGRHNYGFEERRFAPGHIVTPIAKPRGWPEDLSDEGRKAVKDLDEWTHSSSYLTAQELLSYDWDAPVQVGGVVNSGEFDNTIAKGDIPESWCASVGGGGVKVVSTQEYLEHKDDTDFLARRLNDRKDYAERDYTIGSLYVEAVWFMPLTNTAKLLLDNLAPFVEEYGAQNVRIVFGFDS